MFSSSVVLSTRSKHGLAAAVPLQRPAVLRAGGHRPLHQRRVAQRRVGGGGGDVLQRDRTGWRGSTAAAGRAGPCTTSRLVGRKSRVGVVLQDRVDEVVAMGAVADGHVDERRGGHSRYRTPCPSRRRRRCRSGRRSSAACPTCPGWPGEGLDDRPPRGLGAARGEVDLEAAPREPRAPAGRRLPWGTATARLRRRPRPARAGCPVPLPTRRQRRPRSRRCTRNLRRDITLSDMCSLLFRDRLTEGGDDCDAHDSPAKECYHAHIRSSTCNATIPARGTG